MEADLLMNLVAAGEGGDWDGEFCLTIFLQLTLVRLQLRTILAIYRFLP